MNPNAHAVNFKDVLAFVRCQAFSITLRGVLSAAVVAAVWALYYAFAPRSESYRQEVAITLDTREGEAVYPNDKLFSSMDLISAPVLNRVWQERKLSGKVKFEDFCKWFALIGYDRERMKLDAEYQSKMAKRNITVTELATLQRDYEAKLAAQSANNRYVLAMRPTCALSREDAVETLNAVPRVWFEIGTVLNAPKIPSMMRAEVLSAYVKRLKNGNGRALELVDALRLYCSEIAASCDYVRHKVLRGRNVRIDGVDLGVYESRLDLVRSELLRIKNKLLVNGDPADLEGFVAARLDDMACETLAVEEKANAIRQTIDLLKDTTGREKESALRNGSAAEGNVTLQADASFFKDFTAMVRRDASQESIQKFADELSQYSKDLADIKARKLYYDQISQYVVKTRSRADAKTTAAQLFSEVEAYASEMLDVGSKVADFRNRALSTYRTPGQFYALPTSAWYGRSFAFSLARLTLGLLAIALAYNLVCLVIAWNAFRK